MHKLNADAFTPAGSLNILFTSSCRRGIISLTQHTATKDSEPPTNFLSK